MPICCSADHTKSPLCPAVLAGGKMTNTAALYQQLDESVAQFRLLRVLGLRDGRLDCELRTVSLGSEDLLWNALTYRWGDDGATKTVSVNNSKFRVRPNLHAFLLQLACDQDLGWTFIDAICINQNDTPELDGQILLMGEIYKGAQKVIIWIPPNLKNYSNRMLQKAQAQMMGEFFERMRSGKSNEKVTTRVLRSNQKAQRAFERVLFNDEFWSRLWIIQEILLAKRLEFRTGHFKADEALIMHCVTKADDSTLDMELLESYIAAENFSNKSQSRRLSPLALRRRNLMRAVTILGLRKHKNNDIRRGERLSFHRAMILSNNAGCSRPHDRIFGILAIASAPISPRYSRPVVTLFIDACITFMRSILDDKNSISQDSEDGVDEKKIMHDLSLFTLTFTSSKTDNMFVMLTLHEFATKFLPDWKLYDTACLFLENPLKEFQSEHWDMSTKRIRYPRRLFEPYDSARRRQEKLIISRASETFDHFMENKNANSLIESPWTLSDGETDCRSYTAWVQLIDARALMTQGGRDNQEGLERIAQRLDGVGRANRRRSIH